MARKSQNARSNAYYPWSVTVTNVIWQEFADVTINEFVTKERSFMADTVSRSWFAVLPYPEKIYEGSPEEIVEKMKSRVDW